jgi:hypothetical protein
LNDEVYVSTCPGCGASAGGDVGIYHFPAGATTADTSVTGTTTGLTVPGSIGVDHQREVVIGNSFGGSVSTYAVGATGDVAPLRSFTPASNTNLQSIAVGLASIAITNPSAGIELYDPAATGTATPVTTIGSSTQLPIGYPSGIAVDHTVTPPIIVLNDFSANAIYVIQTAGTEPNLTVASVRTISGATTTLNQPLGVAIVR